MAGDKENMKGRFRHVDGQRGVPFLKKASLYIISNQIRFKMVPTERS